MPDLSQTRRKIDEIDARILSLFAERTDLAADVAAYKRAHGLRVLDPARERQKVEDASGRVPPYLATSAQVLMRLLMQASRARQHGLLGPQGEP